ncbi:ATP-binding protein, partial [Pseudomonadota bacterium]
SDGAIDAIHVEKLGAEEGNVKISEARLANAQRIAKVGNWQWDIEANALWWSDEIYRIFGLNSESFEITYAAFLAHIHPDDRDLVSQAMDRALHHSEPYNIDHRIVTKNGFEKVVHEQGEVKYGADGKPVQMVGTVQDITDRKHMEDALVWAKAEAEEANMAKSKFLSSMSHELRTPLNAILGFGQLLELKQDSLDEKQQESVRQIIKGGKHLLTLVNDVLDFARIESGDLALTVEDVSVDDVVGDCLTLSQPSAAEYKIDLVSERVCADFPMVRADRDRFKQVLLNILSNAIKYNREGGKVRLACALKDDVMLHISVSDTGRGIAPQHHDKVFQAFNRLGAESSDIEGTGIGLSICKDLMDKMNGTIGFESTEGVGSIFFIELPLAAEAASEEA